MCYDFSKSYIMFFRIYSGFSGSLYGSMSNFDGLFLFEFYPVDSKPWHNDPYVLKFYAMIFLKNPQLFFWIYSGLSGSLCGSMSVQ